MQKISVSFPELDERIELQLDESAAPNTVNRIIEKLPIKVKINRWGEELYSDPMPVKADPENAKSTVNRMDVAYWPDGDALCLFFGPTPISKGEEIKPYSPVNVIGKIISRENMALKIKESTQVIIDR